MISQRDVSHGAAVITSYIATEIVLTLTLTDATARSSWRGLRPKLGSLVLSFHQTCFLWLRLYSASLWQLQVPPPAGSAAPAPPSPPAPPAPACTNPNPSLCPVVNATYYSYYHKTRYQDACTFMAGNPGLALAPAPQSGEVMPTFPPGTALKYLLTSVWLPCVYFSCPDNR